jgi:hypothetical protein
MLGLRLDDLSVYTHSACIFPALEVRVSLFSQCLDLLAGKAGLLSDLGVPTT